MKDETQMGASNLQDEGGLGRRNVIIGGAIGASMLAMYSVGASAQSQTPSLSTGAADNLNLALNIEYLLNQYYRIGVYNIASLEANRINGIGTAGLPTGGRKVKFEEKSQIQPVMTEILFQQGGHIDILRSILRTNIAAQPAMNIAGDETGAFTQFARYAGIVTAPDVFDPYANEVNFLVGGYIIEEAMQRLLRSIIPTITDALLLEPLCGLFGTHAYYSGMLRETLLRVAQTNATIFDWVDKIAAALNTLTGQAVAKGIRPATLNGAAVANHSAADTTGSVAALTPAQTLNIYYIVRGAASAGGFFPAGVNGTIKTSAA